MVPEMFYAPAFLRNLAQLPLGERQDGTPLNDVHLPPWAEGSPERFVAMQRRALESEFVSSRIHHWIDLIFGSKSRGAAAREADNVFYHLTYPESVDLDALDDEGVSCVICSFLFARCVLFPPPPPPPLKWSVI